MKKLSAISSSLAFVAFAFFSAACSDSEGSPATNNGGQAGTGGGTSTEQKWVGTWATGLQITEPRNLPIPAKDSEPYPDDPGFAGKTLRQVIQVSIGGSKLRLRLSNEYGVSPLTLEGVHVAKAQELGAIDTNTDKELAFSGMPSVTIPAGQAVLSDTFDFDLPPLSRLAITMKVGALSKEVTGHPGSRTTSYMQDGDFLSDATLPTLGTEPDIKEPLKTAHWYFISALDVMAAPKSGSVVVLGDSLTDGRGTTTDAQNRWTDVLASRLQANPDTAHVGVLNQGIGGNTILTGGLGPTAKTRFDQDVLAATGVKWLIVLEGVNDIGNSSSDISGDLIAAYEEFITKAQDNDIKAYGSPILPFKGHGYGTEPHLAMRTTVNEWIRTSGKFDAVIDLDEAVRDPADPEKLADQYATLPASIGTDYLHLNPDGYKAMGEAVDLNLFK